MNFTHLYFVNMFLKFLNCLHGSHHVSTEQCCPRVMENESFVQDFIPPMFCSLNHTSLLVLLARMGLGVWPVSPNTMNVIALSFLVPLRKGLRLPASMKPLLLLW